MVILLGDGGLGWRVSFLLLSSSPPPPQSLLGRIWGAGGSKVGSPYRSRSVSFPAGAGCVPLPDKVSYVYLGIIFKVWIGQ